MLTLPDLGEDAILSEREVADEPSRTAEPIGVMYELLGLCIVMLGLLDLWWGGGCVMFGGACCRAVLISIDTCAGLVLKLFGPCRGVTMLGGASCEVMLELLDI